MNAQQIRSAKFEFDNGEWETARWTQELAAQLAEQTAIMADTLDLQRSNHRLVLADHELRIKQMQQISDAQGILATAVNKNSETMGVVRMIPQGSADEPQHLGCIVRMPDGSHSVVNEAGQFSALEPDQAAPLIAILQVPDQERKTV